MLCEVRTPYVGGILEGWFGEGQVGIEDRTKTQVSRKKAKGAMWMLHFRSFDS